MPSDNERRDAGAAEAGTAKGPPRSERSDRALGRGLEDISHLFLSQTADASPPPPGESRVAQVRDEPWSPPPARESAPPPIGSGHVLLRPGGTLTRDQFAAVLREFDSVLEDGLRRIDSDVPCDPCGVIDVVAVDATKGLVLIDFDVARNDVLLLRGMDHLDWATRNMGNLRRMYPGIDVSREPRLLLLAPAFSPLLGRVVRQIARPRIVFVKLLVADVSGRTGVLFERLEIS